MRSSHITITDQFCGAGGSSIGAVATGGELRLALNHWRLAIETHNTNFPQADHDCTDISAADPRRYPSTDILITSPECTNHSLAKGRARAGQMADLFGGQPDPSAERSRATMWDVPRFAEYHRYRLIVVENVVDARHWITWDAWLHAMHLLGYDYQVVYFNSQFAHPTPQSRDRLYVIFWRRGNRAPDLDFRPLAWCGSCGQDVGAVQSWKRVNRRWGRYGEQYVYRCPTCAAVVRPYYYAAANIVDWALPIQRIGDRVKPLKEKTRARIQAGLDKFTATPFAIETVFGGAKAGRAHSLSEPAVTQTTRQSAALVVPPYIVSYYSTDDGTSIDAALPTVTTVDRHGLVVPPALLIGNYSPGWARPVTGPMGTVTSYDHHSLLTMPQAKPAIDDCGFRMLQPHEIQAAMAFPDSYVVLGNKRDRVRQLGNAVTPPVMSLLFQRIIATLM